MEQNTQAWLKWRHSRIGSSDANIIMEVSKYKKRAQLLLEKQTPFDQLPEDKDSGPIAALGHIIEDMERPRFELMMDDKFPATLKECVDVPFLSASYDGLNASETKAWEHKLMGKEMFEQVANKKCPEQYKPQIQQQFVVTPSLEEIQLCCVKYEKEMLGKKLNAATLERAKMIVKRDDDYIENKLLPELKKFWSEVLDKRDWTDLIKISRKRTRIKNLIKKLSDKVSELDPIIIENVKDAGNSLSTPSFSFNYGKQTRVSFDTKQMLADGIDLSKYEKKSEFYVLKVTERKKKK